jgi:hypothetical protein
MGLDPLRLTMKSERSELAGLWSKCAARERHATKARDRHFGANLEYARDVSEPRPKSAERRNILY